MKKICFLHRSHFSLSTGGAELQAHFLAQHFVKTGWDVHYVLEEKNSSSKVASIDGITFHWIKQRAAGAGLLNFVQLSHVLRRIAPDVLYQRGALDYTGIVAFLARQQKIKYVWAAASNRDCQKTKYRGSPLRVSGRLKRLINPKFLAADWLVSYGIRHADVAVVQSHDQQHLLARNFGKPSHVIKSGHPVPERLRGKSATPIVLWTANMKAWKRVDSFIALARACEDLPANFLVIGKDRRKSLRELATPAIRNFQYLGPRDVAQVEDYMCAASIFVNTSTSDYEGFPNTFIQAWMRRTPVVSLNTDPDGVIKTHQLGLHSGNFDQLVRDIRTLSSDQQLQQRMGENAYHYATREHNICNTVNAVERLIAAIT